MDDEAFDRELLARDKRERMKDEDSLQVQTRWGSLKAGGPVAVIVLFVLLSASFGGYMQWDHNHQNADRANDIKAGQKDIVQAQKRVEDALDSAAYILTLDEKERRALKMDMPDSLRKKVGRDR